MIISIPGIIISGGWGGFASGFLTSVEVLNPITGESCSLPAIPEDRSGHTMENLTICGGSNSTGGPGITNITTTCITFSSGEWVTSNTLVEERVSHSSWDTDAGTILFGGFYSPNTTEKVTRAENEGVPGFTLQHDLQ